MDQFVRGVTLLSQICGVFAAALIAASVVIVCEMVFVRYRRAAHWGEDNDVEGDADG